MPTPESSRTVPRRRHLLVAMAATAALLAAACGSSTSESSSTTTTTSPAPRSIVVLGDSVAAGEGINYGYSYDATPPAKWTGGTTDPTWDPPYPLCHDSSQAYGNLTATAFGAQLAKFACTGASYANGITAPRILAGTTTVMRPPEFGTPTDLNPDYVAAKPDVVIITMGANDVSFAPLAIYCATGTSPPGEQAGSQPAPADRCTQQDPTSIVQQLFWDQLPTLTANYRQLVSDIQAQGQQSGKVPLIVVTTYYDPLPAAPSPASTCLDGAVYTADQITYLSSLMSTLNQTITGAVGSMPGVRIADITKVMSGHEWCTSDPWAYGPSVLALDLASQAPIHPTPAGQAAIAQVVEDTIRNG